MSNLKVEIAKRIRSVCGDKDLHLSEPSLNGNELKYLKECVDTSWVSSSGKYVDLLEKNIAEYCDVKHAVVTSNGTSALHLCLLISGVEQGDEVLTPSLTFVATSAAIKYAGAIPHFVDVDESSLGIDVNKLKNYLVENTERRNNLLFNKKTGNKISALVCMHTFGNPNEITNLLDLCSEFNIKFIEDSAEALGTKYKGKHVGSYGHCSALSFNGNKIITTGGGGAVLTNDEKLAQRAKYLSTTAKEGHKFEFVHHEVGYNYRMPNLNAALGVAQLEQLSGFLASRRKLALKYREAFSDLQGVSFFEGIAFDDSNHWLNCLILEDSDLEVRDEILEYCLSEKIFLRPLWKPSHLLRPYENSPRMDLSITESLYKRVINIPSSSFLGEAL